MFRHHVVLTPKGELALALAAFFSIAGVVAAGFLRAVREQRR